MNRGEQSKNKLSEADVDLIIKGVAKHLGDHYCRFAGIKTEDMAAIVPFMLKFKTLSEKVGSVVLYVVVSVLAGGAVAIFFKGLWIKVKGE